jgi:ribosomal protein L11 methylase PrmA
MQPKPQDKIEECLEIFNTSLLSGGQLICSGFLVSDIDSLSLKLKSYGFEILNRESQGEWAVIVAKKAK